MTDNAPNATYTPQRDRIFADMKKLVSFNSVHSTPELADQHEAACAWTVEALENLGLEVTRYPTVDDADTIVATKPANNGAPGEGAPGGRGAEAGDDDVGLFGRCARILRGGAGDDTLDGGDGNECAYSDTCRFFHGICPLCGVGLSSLNRAWPLRTRSSRSEAGRQPCSGC